ncbi:TylF/MycF/NovP-related O-methyltransferase [Nonomuraea sp. NPDC046802]|uniref:TylF/MycF/NovP-related O-methyltransferase n=1 Tax=Nonomuraea sp. NPDC046802 TaxID=3154919 RepID=UPI0033CB31EB
MPTKQNFYPARGWKPENDLIALSAEEREIIADAAPYTMTGLSRLHALMIAVRHIVVAGIPGAFAECGVWRGGSVRAIATTLLRLGITDRTLYLFDTFSGMTDPGEEDVSAFDGRAIDLWEKAKKNGERLAGDTFRDEIVNESAVRSIVLSSGYPESRVHTVRGPVEETLPGQAPAQLALLRLDTDFYQSTKHELQTLYPRLAPGGVLIVDDYGHWQGARQAVDEYFAALGEPILLTRVDYTCRLAVKPGRP